MNFEKLYNDSQLPVIQTKFSAGLDLYSYQDVEVKPFETVVVGLGIRSIFTEIEFREGNNQCFILELRSSLRAKGLTSLGTGIIDMDYQGEWLQVVCNLSKESYTVKKGDTLGHIAEDYNTRASEIRKWNNMGSSSRIYPGQKLTLFVKGQPVKDTPKKNVYIVRAGDNLSMIAKNNNTTIAKIKSWNSMKSSTIYPGQKLTIYFE